MADQLIRVAAEREFRKTDKIVPPVGLYEEFCAKFKYNETEDKQSFHIRKTATGFKFSRKYHLLQEIDRSSKVKNAKITSHLHHGIEESLNT